MKNLIPFILILISTYSYSQVQIPFTLEVLNRETGNPVPNTNVYLFEMPSGTLVDQQITSSGTVNFTINPRKSYQVQTCNSMYLDGGMNIYRKNAKYKQTELCISGAQLFGFTGTTIEDPNGVLTAQIGIDEIVVGKTFKLDNIYFPLDKAYLTSKAKRELNYVYELLIKYPTLQIEMGSHTDSRASDQYNDDLSQRRAKSTYDYLIAKGIEANRLQYKGYGENQLLNECADGVKCSERKHQINRRTEFKITGFNGKICGEPTAKRR